MNNFIELTANGGRKIGRVMVRKSAVNEVDETLEDKHAILKVEDTLIPVKETYDQVKYMLGEAEE